MEVLIPCLIFTVFYYFIAISVWREGSWSKKSFLYDPVALFMMILCFILGTISLCGVYVGYDCVVNDCDKQCVECEEQ